MQAASNVTVDDLGYLGIDREVIVALFNVELFIFLARKWRDNESWKMSAAVEHFHDTESETMEFPFNRFIETGPVFNHGVDMVKKHRSDFVRGVFTTHG